jgi:uncharacterized protein DUF4193
LSGSSPSQAIAAQLVSVWVLVPSATRAHDVIDRISAVRRDAFAEFDHSAELVVYRRSVGEQSASWQRCHGTDLDRRSDRMPTDYDAPRVKETDDVAEESLDELATRRRTDADAAVLDVDDGDPANSFELPDADLSGEELTVRVVPKQADEFTCSSCFLVQHRNRLALQKGDQLLCADCV